MNPAALLDAGDGVSRAVAALLLLMSVASWVIILWKSYLLFRAHLDVARSVAAFWQAGSHTEAALRVKAFDRHALLTPLLAALQPPQGQTLGALTDRSQQLTRVLREALQQVMRRLQFGQVVLASVGSTAPFVGLLGTVWGIYHALVGLSGAGQFTLDKISGPVGEALLMTAAGLVVAIPAVLAYNILGRQIGQIEIALEGFALDLRELVLSQPARNA
jgi:biopolymer transport protein ExbB